VEERPVSNSERTTEAIRELKFHLFSAQSGRCFSCGEPMAITAMEAAHRIPDRKWTVKLFGKEVINHPKNFRGTHAGRCNDRASLNPDSILAEDLAREIQRDLRKKEQGRFRR